MRRAPLSMTALIPALLMAVAVFTGCSHSSGEKPYLQFVDFGAPGWRQGEAVEFVPDSAAIAARSGKDVTPMVMVRYTRDASVGTLPMEVLQESYAGEVRRDTLQFPLFNADGTATGRSYYSVAEATMPLPQLRLPEGWQLTVTPLASAKGIVAAGLRLQ